MITNYPVLTRLGVSLIDILVTIASFIVASHVRNALLQIYEFGAAVDWYNYWIILMIIVLVWRGLLGYQESYLGQRFTSLKSDILIVIKTVLFGTLIILTLAFMIKSNVPRTLIGIFAVTNFVILSLEKALLYQFIKYLRNQGKNIKRILVLGTGDVAKAFTDSVRKYPDWGIKVLGLICRDECDVGKELFGYKMIGHTDNLRELLHNYPIDELVIALPAKHLGNVEDAMIVCDEEGVTVRIISPFFRNLISKAKTDLIHGLPIIKFSSVERNDFEEALKRLIDILVSFVVLLLLAPVFGIIALLIKMDSPGPVFYRWKVLALNKRPLTSYKFRTMAQDADNMKKGLMAENEMNGIAFKMTNDPRITRVGRWLRKYSLDELPQLWSVLKGDLSLVGPRPPLQTEVEQFEGWHRRKLSVKPGITCLWQVNGRNDIDDFNEWMRLDMQYIDNWSLWLDIKILFKTVLVVLAGTGK